jgi:hypothetical protein
LIFFTIKLVRILDSIPFNSNNKCVIYLNFITDLQIGSPERIEFRRRAEDKVLREFYQIMREAISELEDL